MPCKAKGGTVPRQTITDPVSPLVRSGMDALLLRSERDGTCETNRIHVLEIQHTRSMSSASTMPEK